MKIDEGCIDHNVVRLINELTEGVYDRVGSDTASSQIWLNVTHGEIHGILLLAEALKEVLKC